jgi:hypothetical protein
MGIVRGLPTLALAAAAGIGPVAAATRDTAHPVPAHIVIVVEENHGYSEIIGNPAAPFINELAAAGALYTDSHAVAHPSEPNYLALFSGSTEGVADDGVHLFPDPTLAGELRGAGMSFTGFVESGSPRKHNPWESFVESRGVERPLSAFPADPLLLPTVAFVIPNLAHDMHDGSVAAGDRWLRAHLGRYAAWAPAHRSLLILTFDEDDNKAGNRIATIIAGAGVRPGPIGTPMNHFSLLRTVEAMLGLPGLAANKATPVAVPGLFAP